MEVVTNMSKIQSESNSQPHIMSSKWVICCDQYVKDTIWKQFTTNPKGLSVRGALWPICQRYNLKAIHNQPLMLLLSGSVVTNMSKIQSESNSQQRAIESIYVDSCDQYVKDTIWKQFTTIFTSLHLLLRLWPICQRYNLKAIHNIIHKGTVSYFVVTNMSKIQSESNSQPTFRTIQR